MAYAGLHSTGPARTPVRYDSWVTKLATREFADELVLLCVASELKIRIVCIPYTPGTALDSWAISMYDPANLGDGHSNTIYLGNNDVHYMYLSLRAQ